MDWRDGTRREPCYHLDMKLTRHPTRHIASSLKRTIALMDTCLSSGGKHLARFFNHWTKRHEQKHVARSTTPKEGTMSKLFASRGRAALAALLAASILAACGGGGDGPTTTTTTTPAAVSPAASDVTPTTPPTTQQAVTPAPAASAPATCGQYERLVPPSSCWMAGLTVFVTGTYPVNGVEIIFVLPGTATEVGRQRIAAAISCQIDSVSEAKEAQVGCLLLGGGTTTYGVTPTSTRIVNSTSLAGTDRYLKSGRWPTGRCVGGVEIDGGCLVGTQGQSSAVFTDSSNRTLALPNFMGAALY